VRNVPVNISEWKHQKSIIFKKDVFENSSDYEIGYATFYLNRCNRSGLFDASPIGGYLQEGKWKIDARFNKNKLIEKIEEISLYKNKIAIYNHDAMHFFINVLDKMDIDYSETLIYLDPPYFKKGPSIYRKSYSKKQHEELSVFLRCFLETKWVLSYDDNPYIRKLYANTRINGFSKNHFAYKARIGNELIIVSDKCILPSDISNE
jgi:DNA adenine methylase